MQSFSRIIAIVGLPRSGTTLAAAIFDAHKNTCTCFEPWNSDKNNRVSSAISTDELIEKFSVKTTGDPTAFVLKETSIAIEAIDWLDEFLDKYQHSHEISIVWTVRKYRHTYLSLIDGARKYWGHNEMEVNVESYNRWVKRANRATRRIQRLYRKYGGLAYSYDALVANPETLLPKIIHAAGLDFQQQQLDYFDHVEKSNIRGDVGLSRKPAPISNASEAKREKEWDSVYETLKNAEENDLRIELDKFAETVGRKGFITGPLPLKPMKKK